VLRTVHNSWNCWGGKFLRREEGPESWRKETPSGGAPCSSFEGDQDLGEKKAKAMGGGEPRAEGSEGGKGGQTCSSFQTLREKGGDVIKGGQVSGKGVQRQVKTSKHYRTSGSLGGGGSKFKKMSKIRFRTNAQIHHKIIGGRTFSD